MRLELLKLQRGLGLTTIYVTHDQEEALALSAVSRSLTSARSSRKESRARSMNSPPTISSRRSSASRTYSPEQFGKLSVSLLRDRPGSLMVHVALPAAEVPPKSGAKVVFSIRPEAIELYGEGGGAPTDRNRIDGEVVASAYQGSSVEYEIMSMGQTIKARAINPKGKRLYQPGERVSVAFRPEDVVLVPGKWEFIRRTHK
jgi:ABC-type Fe3+/spermidine/putrescine transport system ATPase subunit